MNFAPHLRPERSRLEQGAVSFLGLLVVTTAWLAAGAETVVPDAHSSEANAKLLRAVAQGNPSLLQVALAEGADAKCIGTNGLPPLLELLRAATAPLDPHHRQCVACLLAHGAAVDPLDSDRRSPLIHAARLGDLETIRLLVQAGAHVMARDRFHKSALFYAVEAHRRDIVLYLAANGDLLSLPLKDRKATR